MVDIIDLNVDAVACGNILCSPDWYVKEKGAIFHRIYYVYGGNAVYRYDGVQHQLKKGHIYIFPVNRPYTIDHDALCPLQCLWFHVTTIPVIIDPMVCHAVPENTSLFHLLKTIELMIEESSFEHRNDALSSWLLKCMVLLLQKEIGFKTLKDECMLKVLDHIHQHYCEKITTICLAGITGFDHYYFNRLFKKTFGVSPQKYISDYRFSKAMRMLLEKAPVSEVSESIGFQDAKAFSRAFKKAKGMSPSDFRKSQFLQP